MLSKFQQFQMFFIVVLLSMNSIFSHEIMSYEQYSKLQHNIPYTFTLEHHNQHLFYFGANHSCDPENEQYPRLEQFWNNFLAKTKGKNCVVFVEGGLRNVRDSKTDAIVISGGEGGFITFLAAQENIKRFCPEPTEPELFEKLKEKFSSDEIHYLRFAQICLSFHRHKAVDPELNFETFYQKFSDHENFQPLETMKQIHSKLFDTAFDITDQQFFYNVTNPVAGYCKISYVARAASQLRDQHIVNWIQKFLKQGNNVFVVYGYTHAVMQEPALRNF